MVSHRRNINHHPMRPHGGDVKSRALRVIAIFLTFMLLAAVLVKIVFL